MKLMKLKKLKKLDEVNEKEVGKVKKTSLTPSNFLSFLLLEKSLSHNTVAAYGRDVAKLLAYFSEKGIDYKKALYDDLAVFVENISEDISPRSKARVISGIRSFYEFLLLEKEIETDPTELLETPKIGLHLPQVLSVEEIDRIIAAIDLSHPQGQRNRAIVETLYSCGLRVSELTDLRLSNVYFDEEFVKVTGKGSKQRLVPLSKTAIKEIKNWLIDRHPIQIKKGHEDYLFLNRNGRKLTRAMIFHLIKEYAKLAGITKEISPHTFRHSFATHLLEGGANLRVIQEMLGHESILTTEIYTHLDVQYLRDVILEFHPRNSSN